MRAGVGGLIQLGPETMQRVTAVTQRGGGGVTAHRLWGQGELEFEAYMRMLDSKVSARHGVYGVMMLCRSHNV